MYLLLLLFGGALSAAGMLLAASGVSIHDHSFDTAIVTPGVVAAVGGLLLIGLGLALRLLRRIEHALLLRQAVPAEAPSNPVQLPLPPKPAFRSLGEALTVSDGKKHFDDVPEKSPAVARLETTLVVEATERSLSANAAPAFPAAVNVGVAEGDKAHTPKRQNGAAPARSTPRLDMSAASPGASEPPAGPSFDALWPKGPRLTRAAASVAVPVAAAPAVEPQGTKSAADAAQTVAPDAAPVSVLKSGVVDGMAYTLYSDGSIEAQLPQGTLRFGSITELRNHIEQSA